MNWFYVSLQLIEEKKEHDTNKIFFKERDNTI